MFPCVSDKLTKKSQQKIYIYGSFNSIICLYGHDCSFFLYKECASLKFSKDKKIEVAAKG